jgi:hypothetical protein
MDDGGTTVDGSAAAAGLVDEDATTIATEIKNNSQPQGAEHNGMVPVAV